MIRTPAAISGPSRAIVSAMSTSCRDSSGRSHEHPLPIEEAARSIPTEAAPFPIGLIESIGDRVQREWVDGEPQVTADDLNVVRETAPGFAACTPRRQSVALAVDR